MKYIFGPVPSRRLGLSLGLDVIPFKYCSLDCIYCECGKTTNKTVERKPYVKTEDVLSELNKFLTKNIKFNYITFSGSGEPTLNSEIGNMITEIKKIIPADKKIAILTNGTLFYKKEVRTELLKADLVVPSLDAASQKTFYKINRAPIELKIKKIIKGLIKFRKEFKGKIWLEIFFLKNINDTDKDISLLINASKKISPDKIQLNTIDRPPAEQWAQGLNRDEMNSILKKFLTKKLPVEVIKRFNTEKYGTTMNIDEAKELIMALISRRPETLHGISAALNLHINNVNKILSILDEEKKIALVNIKGKVFYKKSNV